MACTNIKHMEMCTKEGLHLAHSLSRTNEKHANPGFRHYRDVWHTPSFWFCKASPKKFFCVFQLLILQRRVEPLRDAPIQKRQKKMLMFYGSTFALWPNREKDSFNNLTHLTQPYTIQAWKWNKTSKEIWNNNSPSKEKRHLWAQCNTSTNTASFPWENIKMLCKSIFSFLWSRKVLYIRTNKTSATYATSLSA